MYGGGGGWKLKPKKKEERKGRKKERMRGRKREFGSVESNPLLAWSAWLLRIWGVMYVRKEPRLDRDYFDGCGAK